jgi:hypothetical protein
VLRNSNGDERCDQPAERLRPAPALVAKAIAKGCVRRQVLARSDEIIRISRLIDAGAWVDAAIALVEFELPSWKLRRLAYENGKWLCSLSRRPPAGREDAADANNEVLPLAILGALAAARRIDESAQTCPSAEPP